MKRAIINMSIENDADMAKVVGEFEAMGGRVVHKTFNYVMDDWVVDLPDDKVEDLHRWLEQEGYDGPWNGYSEGDGGGWEVKDRETNTQFPLLVEDGGTLLRTAVSADGATFGIAKMMNGTFCAYPERNYFEATGLAALVGNADETEEDMVERVHRW